MKAILAALILCAGAADASIYHYRYTGPEMVLTEDWDRDYRLNYLGENPPPTPTAKGPYSVDIRINAAHLPGRVLGAFSANWWYAESSGPLFYIEPTTGKYRADKSPQMHPDPNLWFDTWYRKYKQVSFNFAETKIVGWDIKADGDYLSQGAWITDRGDRFSTWNIDYTTWESQGPGSWQLIGISEVPLPASAVLLVGALGGLGAARRLRKR